MELEHHIKITPDGKAILYDKDGEIIREVAPGSVSIDAFDKYQDSNLPPYLKYPQEPDPSDDILIVKGDPDEAERKLKEKLKLARQQMDLETLNDQQEGESTKIKRTADKKEWLPQALGGKMKVPEYPED